MKRKKKHERVDIEICSGTAFTILIVTARKSVNYGTKGQNYVTFYAINTLALRRHHPLFIMKIKGQTNNIN